MPKKYIKDSAEQQYIEVVGAREHNLRDINVSIPRNTLVVLTGVSGSGKSSLAFDTLYAEGQRRYMESFSVYVRNMIGGGERPDVDKIEGLSPVVSIEQKTTSRNPRSTVGTTTEIYDFIRLLYARAAEAYSYLSGEKMVERSEKQIQDVILKKFDNKKVTLLAPVVKGRKGHYRELLTKIAKKGYHYVRIDGTIQDLVPKMQLDRFKIHDIEIVIDRMTISQHRNERIRRSIRTALQEGKGTLLVVNVSDDVYHYSLRLTDPKTGISYDDPAPNTFSFNSPYGACPTCEGLGHVEEILVETIIPDMTKSISEGGILLLGKQRDTLIFKKVEWLLQQYQYSIHQPISDMPRELLEMLLYGSEKNTPTPSRKYEEPLWNAKFEGIINFLKRQKQEGSKAVKKWAGNFTISHVCRSCQGGRLKKESLHFRIADTNIAQLTSMQISTLSTWVDGIESRMQARQRTIAKDILKEIRTRIHFLTNVGLGYLTLDRPLLTLSGGEAQRIRLATQVGAQLMNILYILDEPSIGLHARDNSKLIKALKKLRDIGNSVIVVEHDKEMMMESDYILDLGPGAGKHGGSVVAQGTPKDFLHTKSITASYLSGRKKITSFHLLKQKKTTHQIVLKGASGHNLKNVNVSIPLGKLVCVTGVSGSGKSTLIHRTLVPILKKTLHQLHDTPLPHKAVEGTEHVDRVIEVSQSPIGRTPRSNPATYTGMFTYIRDLYAQLPEAKIRGYKPGRFSFNVQGGRCETCQGAGLRLIAMDFLPDVHVICETCKGRRYNRETLEVRFKSKSIADVLDMTIEKAVDFFENQPRIARIVKTLNNVGLGYLSLGQHATTLSGGEAQRVKLATELSKKNTGEAFYVLDEPTTGLHFQDVEHLLDILFKLVEKGNTVLVIEHNMDVIKVADHIIDLGPEGGNAGGNLVVCGTPAEITKKGKGYTAMYLHKELVNSASVRQTNQ